MMTDSSDPSCSQSAESTPPDKTENLKVVVRCRQMKQKEIDAGLENLVEVDASKGTVVVKNPRAPESHPDDKKTFTFDTVYDWNSQQSELYGGTFQSVVESVLQGYNGTIFAYGQTGTGKSYVIRGSKSDPALRGVVPRALDQIFQHIQLSKNQQYLVRVSYIQIYQEAVTDLLVGNYGQRCDLKEKPDTGVYIKDLTSVIIKTMGELDCVLKTGDLNRDRFITHTSPRSSTINYIFTVTVEYSETPTKELPHPERQTGIHVAEDADKHIRVGRLHFVDMAGSERAAKTEAAGVRLKEASKIGLSLPAFGSVISALVDEKSKYIPYRNTKLTRLLQDSLGGTAKTVMVACIGPAEYDETVTTLRYANRAKHVKNRPKINVDPKYAVIPVYLEEIERLKAQLTDTASPGMQPLDSKDGENKDGETNSQSDKNHKDNNYKGNSDEAIKEQESHLEVTKENRDALSLKIKAMESMLMTGGAIADQQEFALEKQKETFQEVLVANTERILICQS